jgi:hypothetical protein
MQPDQPASGVLDMFGAEEATAEAEEAEEGEERCGVAAG